MSTAILTRCASARMDFKALVANTVRFNISFYCEECRNPGKPWKGKFIIIMNHSFVSFKTQLTHLIAILTPQYVCNEFHELTTVLIIIIIIIIIIIM